MIALAIIGGVLAILLSVIIIRAIRFSPKPIHFSKEEGAKIDADKAADTLSKMIRCKTVSHTDSSKDDEAEFESFRNLLPNLFPCVYEKCSVEYPSDRAILIRWQGKSASSATVLMAHYDVVSVKEELWSVPPFSGLIKDGEVWGRGTIDTKLTLNGILTAAETLIKEGFVPENDVYMAFGGDEEVGGHGAPDIVSVFRKRNISVGVVIDEGGAVVDGVFPGVNKPSALVGIAEKGMVNIEYSVSGGGGHSSAPEKNTPIDRLARAATRVSKKPFKFRLTPPALELFDNLARHSSFGYRLIFANLWLFSPILNLLTKRTGGELDALVRTTTAFTQMQGSEGMNVIPPHASMVSNHRIIPGESVDGVVSRIRRVLNDSNVSVRAISGMNPSRISVTDSEEWTTLASAIAETWEGVIVSPYLMLACSDSRHWGELSDRVYRFSAAALTKEERALIHGNNERIPISTVVKNAEFYINLIRKS